MMHIHIYMYMYICALIYIIYIISICKNINKRICPNATLLISIIYAYVVICFYMYTYNI